MKATGIIFICIGALNIIAFLMSVEHTEAANSSLSGALMFAALGGYLIHRANQKKKETEEKEKWENGNSN